MLSDVRVSRKEPEKSKKFGNYCSKLCFGFSRNTKTPFLQKPKRKLCRSKFEAIYVFPEVVVIFNLFDELIWALIWQAESVAGEIKAYKKNCFCLSRFACYLC